VIGPDCIIEVGHRTNGRKASWLMDGNPEKPICDRHKQQYETAYDDYSHIMWVPISPRNDARRPDDG
jgi:hypothetical protein